MLSICVLDKHIYKKPIIHYRETNDHGDIIQVRIWRVPKSEDFSEGVKYSLVYIHVEGDSCTRVLGYDNEMGKGHHRHYFGREEPIRFEGVERLIENFLEDVEKVEKILYGEVEEDKG